MLVIGIVSAQSSGGDGGNLGQISQGEVPLEMDFGEITQLSCQEEEGVRQHGSEALCVQGNDGGGLLKKVRKRPEVVRFGTFGQSSVSCSQVDTFSNLEEKTKLRSPQSLGLWLIS